MPRANTRMAKNNQAAPQFEAEQFFLGVWLPRPGWQNRPRIFAASLGGVLCALLGLSGCRGSAPPSTSRGVAQQMFAVTGVVQELKLDGRTAIIRHEAIPHYMSAMTMPFRARD